jgi:hypothetical protein
MAYRSVQTLPGEELESVRRLRESMEGGPGSGPQGGKRGGSGARYPSGSKKPSQLDSLRGDKPLKSLKDHVRNLATAVREGPDDDFRGKLKAAMSAAKSEGNSKAVAAIQQLRKADSYMDKGSQYGSDRMMDRAEDMAEKGIKMLKSSI